MEAREAEVGDGGVISGERRPSIAQLQDVLRRVSLSSFHSKCKESGFLLDLSSGTEVSSDQLAQSGSLSPVNPVQSLTQNGTASKPWNPFFSAESKVNGVSGSSSIQNPFSTQDKDSTINGVGKESKTQPNVQDLFSSGRQRNGWSWPPSSSAVTLEPSKGDFLQNDWAILPPSASSLETKPTDIFQAAPPSWLSDLPQASPSNQKADVFQPFGSKEENPVFGRPLGTNESKELTEPSNERDYLLEYILANQMNEDFQPAPSPTVETDGPDASQNVSRFFPPPVANEDLFQTPDIFSGTPTSASNDNFPPPLSSLDNRVFQSTPFYPTPTSIKADINAFDPLSVDYVANGDPFKPQESQFDKLFANPVGTSDGTSTGLMTGTFKDTSPVISPVNNPMFRRRLPKPTPRRIHKNSNQDVDHHSSSKPAVVSPTSALAHFGTPRIPLKSIQAPPTSTPSTSPPVLQARTSIQNQTPAEEENKNQVYEDVLLIGQERCVEDWPEDSPQLSPSWKPAGKLRLRRDSLKITAESEAALTSETLGKKHGKGKLSKKLRSSFLSRRGSKDKFGDDLKAAQTAALGREFKERTSDSLNGGYGGTLPWGTKFHDGALDDVFSSDQDEHSAAVASKRVKQKKRIKVSVPPLRYRTSSKIKSNSDVPDNGLGHSTVLPASKEDRFMRTDAEKTRFSADVLDSFRPPNKEEGATGYTPSLESKAGYQDEPFSPNGAEQLEMQDCRPKKPVRFIVPRLPRKESKSTAEDVPQKGADLFKASDVNGSELNGHEDYNEMRKPPILRVPPLPCRDAKGLPDSETPEKGADLFKPGDVEDAETWMEEYSPDTKPHNNSHTASRETTARGEAFVPEDFDPPGATSSNYYLSEAAKAEWMSSQMDVRRARGPEDDEERLEGVEEEEGDTDSLMEWWNTVELWDELPSDEEINLKEDETISFTEIAGKVHRGLRVFYKVFTEQAEFLYQHVLFLYSLADDLSNFHRRAKIANITGSTTTAVGGVAAIAGLALAPVTFGASLIVSVVGLGVATAGGITAASAAISDNVHDMNDRKKIEIIVQDYEIRLTEMQHCLRFVAEGIRRLRCHPLLRRNNYYAGNWEVRRALQTVSLVSEPVERAEEIVNTAMAALNSVCKGMDKYFTKDSRELKKGCKKEVTMRVQMLAKHLHDGLVQLNSIREQLLDATGHV
ncbi:uncharacterized protein si:cabz01007807.1 [Pygocentrus nattereri]|nr:uncharacterized protein si:cabz01007807.1 [Pygocentrus nattereri]